jgi:uncharacterized protein (TIGR02118 family)
VSVVLFLSHWDEANPSRRASESDLERFTGVLRALGEVKRALVFTPARTRDPYLGDESAPQLAAELYFDDIAALERAAARDGALQALALERALPSLAGVPVTQQAMLVRRYPVPGASGRAASHACAYLVGYEGPAADPEAWLAHYIERHPPIMARLPGIREIEVCTRLDWYGYLPWRREHWMLRNKVVFDSPAALEEALGSPARHELRADYARFPPFSGRVYHYPMRVREAL